MTTSFLIFGIVFIIAYLIYDFLRASKKHQQAEFALRAKERALQKALDSESSLRNEVNELQSKLNNTLSDPVTNLSSWQLFEDRLKQNIKESERYHTPLGVMFIDIDNFRVINDALSYKVGDALLQEVGERLQTCIRQVDSISRFSKDTFVVLLAQLAKPETAAVVAQRMLIALKEPFYIEEQDLYITVSIGISIYPADGEEAASLLRSADQALHLAKEKGAHSYQFYQEPMHVKSQRELMLHTSLGRESIFEEFVLYYQPILNVKTETIFCMDALLHWQHPQLGLLTPVELFHYAERQRKLNAITEWLLQNACRQFMHWHSLGFAPEYIGIPLSINQLENSQFIYRITQILQELKFDPRAIIFEVKGNASQIPFALVQKAMNMLRYVGIKIAVDDFGSDSFSLEHLKNITVDYLKVAPSLVQDISQDPKTMALVKSIIDLANNLSIKVILQGIESDQQVILLKDLGCELMQGHLLGSPLSAHEVADKMTASTS